MDDFAKGLVADIKKCTEKWHKQNEREIRDASAQSRRRETFVRPRRITIQEAAWKVMETAYAKASADGTLPVRPRQIMYAARGYIQERTGRKLDDRYFTQTFLPDYVAQQGVDWDIVWDARGSLHEPHTNRHVPLGTLEVREYLARPGKRLSASRSHRRLAHARRQAPIRRRPLRREGGLPSALPQGPVGRAVRHRDHVDQGRQHDSSPYPDRHDGRRRRAGLLHPRLRRGGLHHCRHARPRHPALLVDEQGAVDLGLRL